MTLCNTEVIKRIKDMEEQKLELLLNERVHCMSTYQTEADKVDTTYSFKETRAAVRAINEEIMKLKHALNVANATIIVEEFGLTIGECLVYMAQLNKEKQTVELMARNSPKSRHTVYNGAVEYTITNYDLNECKEYLAYIKSTVTKLQLAIDRINLNNTIEI